jgi:hypothetical protein
MTVTWTYAVTPPVAPVSIGDSFTLEPQTDHAGNAKANLLEQFKSLPRMEAFVAAVVSLLQPLEDVCWQLLYERYLYAIEGRGPGEGVQLDGIGRIVGEPRKDRSDSDYIAFLSVRVLINTSNGKINELNSILDLMGIEYIRTLEVPPAHLEIYAIGNPFPGDSFLAMTEAKAAGVGLAFIYSRAALADTFSFSDTHDTEQTAATQGWGSVYSATGGQLAGVFS